jgi:hypothetical protein
MHQQTSNCCYSTVGFFLEFCGKQLFDRPTAYMIKRAFLMQWHTRLDGCQVQISISVHDLSTWCCCQWLKANTAVMKYCCTKMVSNVKLDGSIQRWNEYSLCRVRVESEYRKSQIESKYEYRPVVLEYESKYGFAVLEYGLEYRAPGLESVLESSNHPSRNVLVAKVSTKFCQYGTPIRYVNLICSFLTSSKMQETVNWIIIVPLDGYTEWSTRPTRIKIRPIPVNSVCQWTATLDFQQHMNVYWRYKNLGIDLPLKGQPRLTGRSWWASRMVKQLAPETDSRQV